MNIIWAEIITLILHLRRAFTIAPKIKTIALRLAPWQSSVSFVFFFCSLPPRPHPERRIRNQAHFFLVCPPHLECLGSVSFAVSVWVCLSRPLSVTSSKLVEGGSPFGPTALSNAHLREVIYFFAFFFRLVRPFLLVQHQISSRATNTSQLRGHLTNISKKAFNRVISRDPKQIASRERERGPQTKETPKKESKWERRQRGNHPSVGIFPLMLLL